MAKLLMLRQASTLPVVEESMFFQMAKQTAMNNALPVYRGIYLETCLTPMDAPHMHAKSIVQGLRLLKLFRKKGQSFIL